jgi:hypothetical protein
MLANSLIVSVNILINFCHIFHYLPWPNTNVSRYAILLQPFICTIHNVYIEFCPLDLAENLFVD